MRARTGWSNGTSRQIAAPGQRTRPCRWDSHSGPMARLQRGGHRRRARHWDLGASLLGSISLNSSCRRRISSPTNPQCRQLASLAYHLLDVGRGRKTGRPTRSQRRPWCDHRARVGRRWPACLDAACGSVSCATRQALRLRQPFRNGFWSLFGGRCTAVRLEGAKSAQGAVRRSWRKESEVSKIRNLHNTPQPLDHGARWQQRRDTSKKIKDNAEER